MRKGSGALKFHITVEGKTYLVDVEALDEEEDSAEPSDAGDNEPDDAQHNAPHHAPHADAGPHAQGPGGVWDSEGKVCRSPVMGLVMKVNVTPGQAVEASDLILVLETMKMETNVTAQRAGKVKSVQVTQGEPVKVNQVLVEFE